MQIVDSSVRAAVEQAVEAINKEFPDIKSEDTVEFVFNTLCQLVGKFERITLELGTCSSINRIRKMRDAAIKAGFLNAKAKD